MLARITIIRPGYAEVGGDAGGGLPEPDVGGVLGVHRVPPERLLDGHRLERARQDADVRDRGHQFGEAALDEGDPAGPRDEGGQELEALDRDFHSGFQAEHGQLAAGAS